VVFVLCCFSTIVQPLSAQQNSHIYTVHDAKENAVRLGSNQVFVRGHFWWGKEGSMVFDSGYKAVLTLRYTDDFNSKYSYQELLGFARKSNVATVTGRLHLEPNGRLVLIADDIRFAKNPRYGKRKAKAGPSLRLKSGYGQDDGLLSECERLRIGWHERSGRIGSAGFRLVGMS
jgi:hypothetical protein